MPYNVALGLITTPVGSGCRSVNVPLRQDPGPYANLRPWHVTCDLGGDAGIRALADAINARLG